MYSAANASEVYFLYVSYLVFQLFQNQVTNFVIMSLAKYLASYAVLYSQFFTYNVPYNMLTKFISLLKNDYLSTCPVMVSTQQISYYL